MGRQIWNLVSDLAEFARQTELEGRVVPVRRLVAWDPETNGPLEPSSNRRALSTTPRRVAAHLVRGGIPITVPTDNLRSNAIGTLCRCGASQNKPFSTPRLHQFTA